MNNLLGMTAPTTHFRQIARTAGILALTLITVSCGEEYRPVAIPVVPTPPNPSSFHYVLSLSSNGVCPAATDEPCGPGASTRIDVSGDTNVAVAQVGLAPSHAVLTPDNTQVYVANRFEDTLSSFAVGTVGPVSTISLPAGSAPVFLASSGDTIYAASSGTGKVEAVNRANNVVSNEISLGFSPIALALTTDGKKLYALGQDGNGTGWVVSVNSVDKSTNKPITGAPIAGKTTVVDANINAPVWAVMRSDSARVYVLNSGSGTVTAIDTSSDAVLGSSPAGAGANFMLYESNRNRLYVTNPVANTMTMLDASVDPPHVLATVAVPASPLGVAALPNGSRIYVASELVSGSTTSTQVTILNGGDGSLRSAINLGLAPVACTPGSRFRLFTAASGDSSRVYVSNCDAGGTAIIRTSDDTAVLNIPAPLSALPPSSPGAPPPLQNPVFILAGP